MSKDTPIRAGANFDRSEGALGVYTVYIQYKYIYSYNKNR